jgi:hypothetical protein
MARRGWAVSAGLLALALGGCGMIVPDIKEVWDGPRGTEQIEFEVKKRVYCELKDAVIAAQKIPFFTEDRVTGRKKQIPILPDNWGAQVSLVFQVDESSAANPGVALTKPLENSPLFAANRTRTHDLIITVGPSKDKKTADTHLASQIGQAVGSANRAIFQAQ